jgi:hypothetical protein
LLSIPASLLGVGMVVLGLWLTAEAGVMAQRAIDPEAAKRAIVLAGVGLLAAGQVAFLLGVLPAWFGPGRSETILAGLSASAMLVTLAVAAVLAGQAW